MKTIRIFGVILATILLNGCAPLRVATTVNNGNVRNYKYIYISPTETLTSSTGAVYGNYGSTTTKSVNPSDVIAGILSKEGFIVIPTLRQELADETLIVNYGESGRRKRQEKPGIRIHD